MKAPKRPTIGTTGYRIVPTVLYNGSTTGCLHCDRPFTIAMAAVAMTVGVEPIGYICPTCLSVEARERLSQVLRTEVD